jgi:hypothetical protein
MWVGLDLENPNLNAFDHEEEMGFVERKKAGSVLGDVVQLDFGKPSS